MPKTSRETNVIKRPAINMRRIASEEMRDAIARRAYDIYTSRGGAHGRDVEDWLQADQVAHFIEAQQGQEKGNVLRQAIR